MEIVFDLSKNINDLYIDINTSRFNQFCNLVSIDNY